MNNQNQFEFSRDLMRRVTGGLPGEDAYMKFYLGVCVANIEEAAQTIDAIADGRRVFDTDTLALLRAQAARMRFYFQSLDQAALQFKQHKPELAKPFIDASERLQKLVGSSTEKGAFIEDLYAPFARSTSRGLE